MRNLKYVLLTGMAVAALAGLTACETWHKDNGGRSAGRVVDDKNITKEVKDHLGSEPVYKFTNVDVKTFDGVVQLSGFVRSEDQKERAAQIAQSVTGVTKVVNSIAIAPTPTGSPSGYATNAPPSTAPTTK